MALTIVADLATPPRGSFGANLRGDELHLPVELGAALRRQGLGSPEELVSCAHAFPSLLAAELGWSVEEVGRARAELVELLRGRVRPEILEPAPPEPRSYGARPPSGRGPRRP